MPKYPSRMSGTSEVGRKKVGANGSIRKKAVVKKQVAKAKSPKKPILEELHNLPGPRDVYLWCDYIELRCLVHPDKCFSRQDLIEAMDDSGAAGISVSGDDFADSSDGADDAFEDEADDAADIGAETDAAGMDEAEDDDAESSLPVADKSEARASDLFANLGLRGAAFGEAYPFEILESGHMLRLKEGQPNAAQSLYLQLLLSSSLRFVPKTRRKELTDPFELLSTEIFRGLMPTGWEVHQFGAASSTRYKGHLAARFDALARDWRGRHMLSRDQYTAQNSGDGGLDLVAWHPMGDDERVGIPLAAAQCGCTASDWRLKPLEASHAALGPKLWVQYPWATYYFMPQDLLTVRNEKYDWQRRDWLSQSIVVDRLRILRLAHQFGVEVNYATPSAAVSEATSLAVG